MSVKEEKNVAVLILNSEYENPRYKALPGVVQDGDLMKEMLEQQGYDIVQSDNADNIGIILESIIDKLKTVQKTCALKSCTSTILGMEFGMRKERRQTLGSVWLDLDQVPVSSP